MAHWPYFQNPEDILVGRHWKEGDWALSGDGYYLPVPAGREPWRGFDGKPDTYTNVGYDGYLTGSLMMYSLSETKYMLTHYTVQARATTVANAPAHWELYLYDDNWYTGDTQSGLSWAQGETKTFYFSTPQISSRFQLNWTMLPVNGYDIASVTIYYTQVYGKIWVKKSDIWESVPELWVHKGGVWEEVTGVWVHKSGAWEIVT